MLLLPAVITAAQAVETQRLLAQSLKNEPEETTVVVDAAHLQQLDTSALAVLLECQRAVQAWGKRFTVRNAPPKLTALAKLYGVDVLLLPEAVAPVQSNS